MLNLKPANSSPYLLVYSISSLPVELAFTSARNALDVASQHPSPYRS
jgi:hypothetical protein